ncbi:MAG: hypothetical protein RIS88_2795 [Pseudomonadota bacterium]
MQVYPDLPSQLWPVKRESVWDGLHVEATPTGREFRSLSSTYPRRRYELKYGALARVEAERLIEFYDAMGSGFGAFLFRDRDDDRVTLQEVAVTDGVSTTWQLGRAPNNVPKNMLAYSGSMQSGWALSDATRSVVYPSRDTLDACQLTESTSNAQHYLSLQEMAVVPGQEYTFAAKLLPAGRSKIRMSVIDHTAGATVGYADVDLCAGETSLSGVATAAGVEWLAGGMRLGWVTLTLGAATSSVRVRFTLLNASGIGAYTGDGSSGAILADAELYGGRFVGLAQRTHSSVAPQFLAPIFDLAGAPSIYLSDPAGLVLQTSGYTINATGSVVFSSAPAAGKKLLWSGGFYHRARFEDGGDTDQFARTLFRSGTVRIITVKP